MHRHISLAATLALTILVAACGSSSSPTGPSQGGNPGSGSGAVITGSVRSGSPLLAATAGGSIPGLVVSVVGTDLQSGVDAAGRFTLSGVPAGDVQLRFQASGVDATVRVSQVQSTERVALTVNVEGTSAVVEAEARSTGSQEEIEGRVESLPPTMADGTLKVAGRTIRTDASTRIEQGGVVKSFADLQIGLRVHVTGTPSGGDVLAATIRIQNTNTWIPVQVNGEVESFTGDRSLFEFEVGSRLVKGDDLTEFFGGSEFADLRNDVRVEVKGQQRDGYVYAVRLHVNEDDEEEEEEEEQEASASIHGVLRAIAGTPPSLTLTVDDTTVGTSSETVVQRRGDVQTLEALRTGQTLHVIGTRRSDGSLDARRIQINDDETGGMAEIEGPVGGLRGSCPALGFGINGYDITTSSATAFEGVACAAVRNGTRVLVRGTRQANGSIAATLVRR